MLNPFDDFNSIFERMYNRFSRPVFDQKPYSVYIQPGKGYIVVCNTLGVPKENIEVNIETPKGKAFPVLRIKGTGELPTINFHNEVDLGISLRFKDPIDDVSYSCNDGLTLVYIKTNTEETPKLVGKRIDDNSSLDW